ncbi:MAG: hypothetical protein KA100_05590 [Rickettsiales bacterium]|nr:hypothetical protein [Rickettsiales bacterium]
MKKEAEKEQRQREKKQKKKDLSQALRKNLMRRKVVVEKDGDDFNRSPSKEL